MKFSSNMNANNFINVILFFTLVSFLPSCSKSEKMDNSILEIKVKPKVNELKAVRFYVIIKEPIYVNWGDGSIIEYEPKPLELSDFTKIEHTYESENEQTILIEKANLFAFSSRTNNDLSTGEFKSLSFNGFQNLKLIDCMYLGLEKLSFKNCELLESVICSNNKLKTLDLDGSNNLKSLECSNNELVSLDFSKEKNLKELACSFNPLQTLKISNLRKLEYLFCDNTNITALDVSGCDDLFYIECYDNDFSKESINALFSTLPKISNDNEAYLKINLVEGTNEKIATDKGWNIVNWAFNRGITLQRDIIFDYTVR